MDKETFRFLKHILKTCESKAKESIDEMAERAEQSKNRLFKSLKGGSIKELMELQSHIWDDLHELADKVDAEAKDGTLGRNDNNMHYLSQFVANIQVSRECTRLIHDKIRNTKSVTIIQ